MTEKTPRVAKDDVLVTLDVDWAPDCVIDAVAALLIDANVRATWFITHESPALDRLRQRPDLFELGIHPNFFPGSTHGTDPKEILRHCMSIVPEAKSIRTHGLYQSGQIFEIALHETPVTADVSLFLPRMPNIRPVRYERPQGRLFRIAAYWEDRYEMEVFEPCWSLDAEFGAPGLKVLSFHPIHVYLNTSDVPLYSRVKEAGRLQELTEEALAPHIQTGPGSRDTFKSVLDYLGTQETSLRVQDAIVGY